ncbi:hypothetical protein TWF569_010498 [Orbilia oligospora]|uniref:Uncharacterized protein n=1 Tax=Orbilia oligospora TaxID=2813651 RepID=A0A7C8MVD2_ORBOL|nr:hypothetical protein TWF102_002544 [Orbilia oligospora]KAF3117905.1 hypothetical protein TWF103_004568 [Orbilia oligospora]KAF3154876.1 hypothetical protein TWF569_010498 [Orbilia oligospora]
MKLNNRYIGTQHRYGTTSWTPRLTARSAIDALRMRSQKAPASSTAFAALSSESPGFFKAHGAETFLSPYTFHGGILNQTPRPQLKSDKIL